jgi:hypothetical protein
MYSSCLSLIKTQGARGMIGASPSTAWCADYWGGHTAGSGGSLKGKMDFKGTVRRKPW